MSKISNYIEKLIPHLIKFTNKKPMLAIKDGFILAMPLTLIGSIFLLLANIPIFPDTIKEGLQQVVGSTFDIVALVGVFGIAHSYVKNENIDPTLAGILAIIYMLIVSKSSIMVDDKIIKGVLPKEYLGGKGMVAAIIIGLIVGYLYTYFIKKEIKIKMPPGVPQGIANAFASLIPSICIIVLAFITYVLFNSIFEATFIEKIYEILQIPIQNITDSMFGAILIPLIIGLCWWSGIHGPTLIMGVMGPILTANALSNQAIIDSGQVLVAGENAKILTIQAIDQFVTFGGSGVTLGLVIAMLWKAKSVHFKKLAKLSFIPGLFNINEPIIFGIPIVFNPIMLVPFILIPTISSIIVYIAIYVGFLEPFSGIMIPWGIPPILSGLLLGGPKAAFLQLIIIIMSVIIYYPFMKILDDESYKKEI